MTTAGFDVDEITFQERCIKRQTIRSLQGKGASCGSGGGDDFVVTDHGNDTVLGGEGDDTIYDAWA